MKTRGGQLRHKVKIEWSSNFAYAIGLITSDGYLHKDGRHIVFSSKDLEQVENFKKVLKLSNGITRCGRGGEVEKNYFRISFGDKVFYHFLNAIGLTSKKSKTIKEVRVPENYFPDFLRGLFDGDGSFYSTWDKRWRSSLIFYLTIASASSEFVEWLAEKVSLLYGCQGFVHKGKGVLEIRYSKATTLKLFGIMYHSDKIIFLERKRNKMLKSFDLDQSMRITADPVQNLFNLVKIMPR